MVCTCVCVCVCVSPPHCHSFQVPPRPVLLALLPMLLLGLALAPGKVEHGTCSVPDILRHYRGVIFEDLQAAVRHFGKGTRQLRHGARAGSPPLHPKSLTAPNNVGVGRSGRGPRKQGRSGPWCGAQQVGVTGLPSPCSAQHRDLPRAFSIGFSTPQERDILLSISSLSRTLRGALGTGRSGPLEKAVWTAAMRTEAVMRRHCSALLRQVRRTPESAGGPALSPWSPLRPQTRPALRGSQRRPLLQVLDAVATCWEKLFALHADALDTP
ncbi:uncharacterized protein C20orf204 homolog [Suncus etruscus]|uniref:uncharacterized protein C20orf204 homolog n=1 Tax=Suncus etruscus TaxID=109475 RepID=UPI002110715C|nr:uncharacterized protein C20orf204 homolog [Suncus etruscus]